MGQISPTFLTFLAIGMAVAFEKHLSKSHAPSPRGSHKPEGERSAVCKGVFGVLGHSQPPSARESSGPREIAVCAALILVFIIAVVFA
jgi:hypothetical protein